MIFNNTKKPRIAVIGGSTVFCQKSAFFTKGQFAYYLKQLSIVCEVLWFCRKQEIIAFNEEVPSEVRYQENILSNFWRLFGVKLWVLFLPQAYRFVPLIFLAKIIGIKVITYSGTDFQIEIEQERSVLRKSLRQNIRYIAIRFADSVLVRGRRALHICKKYQSK